MAGTSVSGQLSPPPERRLEDTRYDLAVAEDEAQLRTVLRESPMPGAIRVSFTREPDYFHAEGLLGGQDATVVARQGSRVIGLGRCSTRQLYVNGCRRRVGYLSELRVQSGERGGIGLLRGGYQFFHEFTIADPAEFYFTSIAASNTRVQRLLENGTRWGLPAYRFLSELITLVAPVKIRSSHIPSSRATAGSPEELTAFLDRSARSRNLSMPWDASTWTALTAFGLSWRDFTVVKREDRIVAAALLWDQRVFRQTVIAGYSRILTLLRPLINGWCWVCRRPPLPAVGQTLPQAALLGFTLAQPDAWPELWAGLAENAARRGIQWLTWSTDAADGQWAHQRSHTQAWVYRTRLYAVQWPRVPTAPCLPGDLPFQPEVALL